MPRHNPGVRPGTRPSTIRSVRMADEVWEKAKRRADFEGVTMSTMLARFAEGYGNGLVDLPQVQVVYKKPGSGAA